MHRLIATETEKRRKYDILVNKMGAEFGCATRIIPYVMSWDGIVTNIHRKYVQEIGLADSIEAYIQGIVLKKTLESISLDHRQGEAEEAVAEIQGEAAKQAAA